MLVAWGIICCLSIAVILFGERALHARAPMIWLIAIFASSAAAVVLTAAVLRPNREENVSG